MTDEQIEAIALANGFKLKEQPDGSMALNPYVFEFARAMYSKGRQAYKAQAHLMHYGNPEPMYAALAAHLREGITDEISDFTESDAVRAQSMLDRKKVVIAADHIEAEEFVEWLRLQGYQASVGSDTHNHIGGYDTSSDDEANEKMQDLWNRYCDEA